MPLELKIVAIARDEGLAFIVEDGRTLLLRPPYLASNQIEVSGKSAEKAVSSLGFERCDLTFPSISAVVKYLKDEYITTKKSKGIKLPPSRRLKDVLKYATDDILLEYLEKAKNELIPEGKINAAASLVFDLIELEKVKNNPEMLKMAVEIIEVWNRRKLRIEEMVYDDLRKTWTKRFPLAVRKYSMRGIVRRQQSIAKRGQLLYLD